MTLAMSWDEWAGHDANTPAERVHKCDAMPADLAA